MIICISAKFLASIMAICLIYFDVLPSVYAQAFFIGIFPIWAEVVASYITKIEPARVKQKKLLYIDAATDLFTFILVPCLWYLIVLQTHMFDLVAIMLFVVCGAYRLIRFVKQGLDDDGMFRGLPVTYTGYLWIVVATSVNFMFFYLPSIVIILAGLAMVSRRIRLRPSR